MQTYNAAVFYLRSLLAQLNFPEFITEEDVLRVGSIGTDMSAASIRRKATEVGERVDALETMHNHGPVESNSGWAASAQTCLQPRSGGRPPRSARGLMRSRPCTTTGQWSQILAGHR
ncbi:hypothetical protein Acr_00g0046510 [Actinidia rufa]|uniref:Uncharacterized protein n=1 Tax=Actinidia rufa TaxID=165716 RepID=A0A7J0DJG1_9ERIC|nr:hypothetical protein Acr_00g0046510 [Actinidia rufa]